MRLNFHEEYPFHWGGGNVHYPIIPITMIGVRSKSVETYGLLDSGADFTIFHANWARRIGLDLRSGRPENIGGWSDGAGGLCYFHRITVKIGGKAVRCDVGFCEDMSTDSASQLIGRDAVFDKLSFAIRQKVGLTYVGRTP